MTAPLTRKVMAYQELMKTLVPTVHESTDWEPLSEFVVLGEFRRIGTLLEVQDWPQYTEMLTRWARSIDTFDTVVKRVTEVPGLVYFEIEERHTRGERTRVVNSMTVFDFDDDEKIRGLAVYLQQAQ
ncbi:MAG TPA: hypothetical protein VFW21_04880 [Mycobacterium sp.]|nr:hypothetical protein [Mycobacterium sp.]